ncbi:IS3 family transposase [Glaciimonas immobilis]|uniref:Transposase InsO family protein n=1 Tax=Glaciimonas immobilis TaxID=728004 RepID=A0A840RPR6_9BURK|nr:IS3 family transposase [Glaciimonas immobilis]MBB5198724.1 transposase InsO family protein [Glaciimonas immobilis]
MSRKRKCQSNALTDNWSNLFKNQRHHGLCYSTHAEMKSVSFKYVEVFYNHKRLHSTLDYRSPIRRL